VTTCSHSYYSPLLPPTIHTRTARLPPVALDQVRKASGNPIIISEFGFRAFENDSGDWNLDGDAGYPVATQAQRSAQLTSYIEQLLALPYVVG
jgi:hypothetical protein